MSNRISSNEERRLTAAIEKAATLADMDEGRDRSSLLASCLINDNIDGKFAKVATDAFNKRLTVLRFQKTADEHKADPFALADVDTVAGLMGACMPQSKTAAAAQEREFSIGFAAKPMTKVANTATATRPRYEDTVSARGYMRHLESVMQKQAAAYTENIGKLYKLKSNVERMHDDLVRRLSKIANFEFQTLCNVYEGKLEKYFGNDLQDRKFTKTAGAVKPATTLCRDLDTYFGTMGKYAAFNDMMVDFNESLDEFSKTAAEVGNEMVKTALSAATTAGILLRGLNSTAAAGMQMADRVRAATTDSMGQGFGNAAALYNAGSKVSEAPGKILDASFLIKDRFRDRLMAWSDMSADPMFSMYPAEQVFMATQKAMDMDPALERGDSRELLRGEVGRLLTQNNREDMAGFSALMATLKAKESAPAAAQEQAAKDVISESSKESPAMPELTNIFTMLNPATKTKDMRDVFAEAGKENDKELKNDTTEEKDKDEKNRKALQAILKNNKDYALITTPSGDYTVARVLTHQENKIDPATGRPVLDASGNPVMIDVTEHIPIGEQELSSMLKSMQSLIGTGDK